MSGSNFRFLPPVSNYSNEIAKPAAGRKVYSGRSWKNTEKEMRQKRCYFKFGRWWGSKKDCEKRMAERKPPTKLSWNVTNEVLNHEPIVPSSVHLSARKTPRSQGLLQLLKSKQELLDLVTDMKSKRRKHTGNMKPYPGTKKRRQRKKKNMWKKKPSLNSWRKFKTNIPD
ncbi:hypothetical protein BSL78_20775 [Apostichopus japonicus]|uniref:Uncharacterized protein n=1 Tax=Stichopus japonicus TaxID=307972 RepID=A0A2G8K2Z6_STIJA|nr:hypothetical protein BSL78_20775 [Apostichopus japonicus]